MLDVSEELTSTTGCRGRGLNRRLFSSRTRTLPLSYPAFIVHLVVIDLTHLQQKGQKAKCCHGKTVEAKCCCDNYKK